MDFASKGDGLLSGRQTSGHYVRTRKACANVHVAEFLQGVFHHASMRGPKKNREPRVEKEGGSKIFNMEDKVPCHVHVPDAMQSTIATLQGIGFKTGGQYHIISLVDVAYRQHRGRGFRHKSQSIPVSRPQVFL